MDMKHLFRFRNILRPLPPRCESPVQGHARAPYPRAILPVAPAAEPTQGEKDMLRKYFMIGLLLAQIALFALAAGNVKAEEPAPYPPCLPCAR